MSDDPITAKYRVGLAQRLRVSPARLQVSLRQSTVAAGKEMVCLDVHLDGRDLNQEQAAVATQYFSEQFETEMTVVEGRA